MKDHPISDDIPILHKLADKIFNILKPHYEIKNPKLVKFEIVNYLLFRLFYDKVIEVPDDFQYEYYTAYFIAFRKYVSNHGSFFFYKEIIKRNRMYIGLYYEFQKRKIIPKLDMTNLLLKFIVHSVRIKDEKELEIPRNFFADRILFKDEEIGYVLWVKIDNLVTKTLAK